MTGPQRETILDVTRAHRAGQWYRASGNGQRVSLASLFRHGVLERRVWRVGAQANSAHEYQLGEDLRLALGLERLA